MFSLCHWVVDHWIDTSLQIITPLINSILLLFLYCSDGSFFTSCARVCNNPLSKELIPGTARDEGSFWALRSVDVLTVRILTANNEGYNLNWTHGICLFLNVDFVRWKPGRKFGFFFCVCHFCQEQHSGPKYCLKIHSVWALMGRVIHKNTKSIYKKGHGEAFSQFRFSFLCVLTFLLIE